MSERKGEWDDFEAWKRQRTERKSEDPMTALGKRKHKYEMVELQNRCRMRAK